MLWKFVGMRNLFCCWYPRCGKFVGMRSLFRCWYPCYEKFVGMRSLFRCWYPCYGKFVGMRSLFRCWYPRCGSLWVWEACFVADTHTEKSLWVSEAYSIAIPKSWKPEGITRKLYIPKCLPWVFCILKSFQKPVARSWGKDKQTLSSRRYLARVLSSLMYRYGLRPKRKRVCGS